MLVATNVLTGASTASAFICGQVWGTFFFFGKKMYRAFWWEYAKYGKKWCFSYKAFTKMLCIIGALIPIFFNGSGVWGHKTQVSSKRTLFNCASRFKIAQLWAKKKLKTYKRYNLFTTRLIAASPIQKMFAFTFHLIRKIGFFIDRVTKSLGDKAKKLFFFKFSFFGSWLNASRLRYKIGSEKKRGSTSNYEACLHFNYKTRETQEIPYFIFTHQKNDEKKFLVLQSKIIYNKPKQQTINVSHINK